jgi:predicted RNase H-like HicB family nuclease
MFGTFLIDERRGWGVGDDRTVLYTDDFGQNWTRRNCGIRGNIDDVWFINDTLGWCVGNGVYKTNFSAPKPDARIEPDVPLVELCEGEVLDVRVITSQSAIRWNDGVTTPARTLTTAGVYVVSVYDPATCQSATDTIELRFRPSAEPTITLSKPAACEGDSIVLTLEGAFVQYLWSTGETTKSITVTTPGIYTCTVVDTSGCTRTANAEAIIRPNPTPTIQANRALRICLDETIILSAPSGFDTYQWSSGESSQSITVGEGGSWFVTVIDSFGCVGVSDTVTVVKLETRNKAEIQFASASDSSIVIPDHPIGTLQCGEVVIRNRSTTEPLVIARPYLLGNVFISIPQSQLPVVIAPLEFGRFTICAAAIDTGSVRDTLAIPDTCSTWFIPVRSNGTPLQFQGTSRCDVDVMTLVYSAGDAWRLSDPFPMPITTEAHIGALLVRGALQRDVQALLSDVTGRVLRQWSFSVMQGAAADLAIDVADLSPGSYTLHLSSAGVHLRSSTILVHR